MKKKFLIYLPVYNSFKNLPKIFSNISFYLKDYSIDFLVVDNNSEIYSKLKKISLIKKIKSKNKNINIFLIINNKNYGIGGSMKIMINFAKKNNYSYVCSLLTSGRYNEKMVIKEIKKKLKLKYDYILFSRFKKKKLANKYNRMRFYFNLIFIEMTKYLTKCRFTDPGSIIFFLNLDILRKINYSNITNGSHFGHFLNIYIYNLNIKFLEIPMRWGDGNIKSHLNIYSYVLFLMISLLKFFFTGSFIKENKNKFTYSLFKF